MMASRTLCSMVIVGGSSRKIPSKRIRWTSRCGGTRTKTRTRAQTRSIEILQTIVATAADVSRNAKTVQMGDLVAKATKRNSAKISPVALQTLAKHFVQHLESGDQFLVQELVDFHAMNVNPRDLVVANAFFHTLVTEETLQKAPYTRHYFLLSQHTSQKKLGHKVGGPRSPCSSKSRPSCS